ncbi:MAG: global cell cycle regulator GcrA-like protein [Alphaproteobacteria bacterium]|nr:global cell cycle regulator GcrA-like protein [Alphaproteobacteria bacterium]
MIWTDEAVEELKKMWDKGMTTGQIAKVLNVTKNSIIGKVHRLCLTARPSPIKKSSASSQTPKTTEKKTEVTKEKNKTKETKPKTKTTAKVKLAVTEEVKTQPAPVIEETNIPLVKLDNHTCRWPMGDPKDEDFCFCGKRIKTGQTYCEEHAQIAYVKPGKKI